MTRGFITIATGNEMYYQFAENLLQSYRLFCDNPYPFAIMCDRENAHTALFDQIVLLRQNKGAYFDKFELLIHSPFDETIFLDSDCLAYADLNTFWDFFAQADDFSSSGANYPLDSAGGLFNIDEIGPFQNRVAWKPVIHGGLYFIRRGETCNAIYADCKYILEHYDAFRWPDFCAPYADEPVLALAMAANGCHATEANPVNFGIPWAATKMECDIFTGKCRYATQWHAMVEQGRMIHWSVRYCKKPLYIFETEKLERLLHYHLRPSQSNVALNFVDTMLYRYKLRYYYLCFKDFLRRAFRKIKNFELVAG